MAVPVFNPYEQFAGGVAAGYTSGQAFGNPYNQFNLSGGNVGAGVGSGALSGFAAGGPVGAIVGGLVGGVTSVFSQDKKIKEALDNVNTEFGVGRDIYGRPIYNSQGMSAGIQSLGEMGKAQKKALLPGRRRQLDRTKFELQRNIYDNQQQYNKQSEAFNQQQLGMDQYRKLMDNSNRFRNLYSIGTSLY